MSAAVQPIIRPEVDHLFEAETLARQARRLLKVTETGVDETARFGATSLIDDAIAEMVAARAIINEMPKTGELA